MMFFLDDWISGMQQHNSSIDGLYKSIFEPNIVFHKSLEGSISRAILKSVCLTYSRIASCFWLVLVEEHAKTYQGP